MVDCELDVIATSIVLSSHGIHSSKYLSDDHHDRRKYLCISSLLCRSETQYNSAYPQFPERFIVVPDSAKGISKEAAVGWVEEKAIENREVQFKNLERIIASTAANRTENTIYAIGTKDPTVLDVYIAVIVQWSPRKRSEDFRVYSNIVNNII